jgi:NAD(P)-dependent dehydrogenase (short-subunit alcohol dehydrogenase family)
MRLENHVAIVTGGLSGIGAAVARRLADAGAMVIAADIRASETSLGADAIAPFRCDVADEESVAKLLSATLARHGRVNGLVHCAGIGRDLPFLETPVREFDRILAVNLRGTFLVGQACAKAMAAAGGGAIVNIASISGMRGNVGRAAYGASKGGVITLTQVMAIELAPYRVRVNAIAPGPVETPLVRQMHDPQIREAWKRATPMRRYAEPEEIAGAALFLLSNEANFITGEVLAVDGGFLAAGLSTRSFGG